MKVTDVLDSQFELWELVATGGMGQVFKARDRQTGAYIAIKTLLPQFASDPTAADELRREVKLSQRLQHPNIVRVHEYRVADHVPFIVMEFVEGRPLNYFQVEQPNRRLPEPVFRAFADQILDAVGFAHQAHVVHRDLKPANIMVQPSRQLKLLDFGIAAALKATYTRITGHSSGLTIQYASPEQINGEDPAPSMDIYSLGCVFFEMLAGKPPFHQGEILHQHLTKQPPQMADVSLELNAVVQACLKKHPDERPRSILELKAMLAGNQTVRVSRPAAPKPASRVGTATEQRSENAGMPSGTTAGGMTSATSLRPATTSSRPRATDPPVTRTSGPSLTPFLLIGVAAVLGIVWLIVASSGSDSRNRTPSPSYTPPPTAAVPQPEHKPPPAAYEPVNQRPAELPAQSFAPPEPQGPSPAEIRAEVERHLERGRNAHADGDYEAARAAFRRALALDATNKAARAGIERANRAEKAEAELLNKR